MTSRFCEPGAAPGNIPSRPARFCECCNQSIHKHAQREVRWWCTHCATVLCELQVREEPKWSRQLEGQMAYAHVDPFCPGLVKRQ